MSLKKLSAITVASIVMIAAALILAISLRQDYEMQFGTGEEYVVNGTVKQFEAGMENPPVFDEEAGTLFLPLRWIIEQMGGTVNWNSQTHETEVFYKGKKLTLLVDSEQASLNGYSIILKYPPKYIKDCLYVDSRLIGENFGTEITWNEKENQVTLKTEPKEKPVVNVNTISFSEIALAYTIDVPVIAGLNDSKFEKELNNQLLKEKMTQITDFTLEAQKEFKNSGNRSFWHLKNEVAYRSPELISIVSKGAIRKGQNEKENLQEAITINLQNQKIISMQDLFKNEKYKHKIVEEMNKTIELEQYNIKKLEEGDIDLFNQFYISEKNNMLCIFLKNEQTKEFVEFKIPFLQLKKYLKASYQYLIKE